MKFIKFLATVLVAIGLFSCSKDESGPKSTERVNVTVKIETTVTKADVGAVKDNYTTKVKTAYAYVVDANDKILAGGLFEGIDFENGKTFTDLTTEVADVFVIANWPDGFTPGSYGVGSVLGDIELTMDKLVPVYNDQDDDEDEDEDLDTHGVKYATLYNVSSKIDKEDEGTEDEVWTITATLASVVTRFEIAEISGVPDKELPENYLDIYTYTLSGVYMNNVYTSVKLGGAQTVLAPGATKHEKVYDQSTTFPTEGDWSCDVFVDDYKGGLSYEPTNAVWAYHVSPIDASSNDSEIPQIILHLTSVKYGDNTHSVSADPVNLYVPVVGFKNDKGSIKKFERGNVYRIESLEFNRTHLKQDTNPSDISLIATVTVLEWTVNTVTPEF